MSLETSQILDRLHQVLVEEIRDRHPEYLERPFTVAEIYQNLVPYRSHRDRIGVEMNADYEAALLRLLAGEGDYLEVDSDTARRQIREELDSLNPDTGIYRDFAAVEVTLNLEKLPEPGDGIGGAEEEVEDRPEDEGEGGTEFSFADELGGTDGSGSGGTGGPDSGVESEPDEAPPEVAEPPTDEPGEGSEEGVCPWCRGELPDRDELRFCPHCGSRLDRVPCPECGTELEDDWRFCIACGAAVDDG